MSVLNENNYSMQQGGISVAHRGSKAGAGAVKKGGRLQVAGRDYGHLDYCQV